MKYSLILAALMAAAPVAAVAGFSENGDSAPRITRDAGIVSVAHLSNMADDSRVTLEGHIVRQTRHEHYLFRDDSGESIEVEIDDDEWGGLNVTPAKRVRLEVEIDRDDNRLEVDVKRVRLAN